MIMNLVKLFNFLYVVFLEVSPSLQRNRACKV